MNPQKALGAELLAALAIVSVGAGKFPRPSRYTGVFLLFFVLGVAAQTTTQVARFCTALGGLVVLTLAMGQTGARALGWLRGTPGRLGVTGPAPAPVPHAPVVGAGAGAITGSRVTRTRPRGG